MTELNLEPNKWDYDKVGKMFAMTANELMQWSRSFDPDHRIKMAEDGNDTTYILFTDGDDGMLLLEESYDVFERNGVKMYSSCNYVDLHIGHIIEVLEITRSAIKKARKENPFIDESEEQCL